MKFDIIEGVWLYSKARGTTKLVLLALASLGDHRGQSSRKTGLLAQACGCSKQKVFKALKALEELGELEVSRTQGRVSQYRITLPERENGE